MRFKHENRSTHIRACDKVDTPSSDEAPQLCVVEKKDVGVAGSTQIAQGNPLVRGVETVPREDLALLDEAGRGRNLDPCLLDPWLEYPHDEGSRPGDFGGMDDNEFAISHRFCGREESHRPNPFTRH